MSNKRNADGEHGFRLPGQGEVTNITDIEKTPRTKALATPEVMSARKVASAKSRRQLSASPRPGIFPSSIDQVGPLFTLESNGTAPVNGMNGTAPILTFGQTQQHQQPETSNITNNPSSNSTQGGHALTFNSLGQPHADQKQTSPTPNGISNAFKFTFGAGTSAPNTGKPTPTFTFGGSTGSNTFTGFSQQSTVSSGGVSGPAPAASSFPPNQGSTFSGFGSTSGGAFNANSQASSFSGFGNQQPSSGFDNQKATNGFGNQQSLTGFGSQHPFSGFGNQQASSGFASNTSQRDPIQQNNGIFQQQNNSSLFQPLQQQNSRSSHQQPGASESQQQSQQSQGIFRQPQPEKNNIFEQAQDQKRNQHQGQSQRAEEMETASAPGSTLYKSPPTSSSLSVSNQLSNGDQNSEIAGRWTQTSPSRSGSNQLLNGDQNSESASNMMQTSPPTSPQQPNANQRSIFETMASGDQNSKTSKPNLFAHLIQQPAEQSSSDSSLSTQNQTSASGQIQGLPAFAGFGQNNSQHPPKFDAPSFASGPFADPFKQNSSAKSDQSLALPKFEPPSFKSSPFSNPFGLSARNTENKSSTRNDTPSNNSNASTTKNEPAGGIFKGQPSETAPKPSLTPSKPLGQSTNATITSAINDFQSDVGALTGKPKQAYEAQRALLSLNHAFMWAVSTLDPSEDQSDMMRAYLSAAAKIQKGHPSDAKRKPQDESQEASKKARPNEDSISTPNTQQKSSTANLFQHIISKDTTPSKPAQPSLFFQPKTPTQEPESRSLFTNATGDAPATEPPNPNAGKSLFDRISPNEKPATEIKKPTFSFFPATPTSSDNASPGDHTWKIDSPIKFGLSQTQQNPSQLLFAGSAIDSAATSRATSPGTGDGGTTSEAESTTSNAVGDGEDAANPLKQVDLTAVEPNFEVLYETDKARGMIQDLETKSWLVRGTGPLRLLKDKDSGSIRVLLRTVPSGRVVFNSALVEGLTYKVAGKSGVTFPVVGADGKLETWFLRFKSQGVADEFAQSCEKWKNEASS